MNELTRAPLSNLLADHQRLLQQLRELLHAVDEQAYRNADWRLPGSTFGRQVRHCLDHYLQLLDGLDDGTVDYGDRNREELVEYSPAAALECLDAVGASLSRLDELPPTLQLLLQDGTRVMTSAARELEFLSSHTIHHLAVLGLLAREQGLSVSADIGVAFSTLSHQQRTAQG